MDGRQLGVSTYVHCVPGRLRVRNAHWKQHPGFLHAAEVQAASLDGVESVHSNALTGSLLIHFNPCSSTSEALLHGLLDIKVCTRSMKTLPAPRRTSPAVSRAVRRAGRAACAYAGNMLLEHAVEVMIAAIL